MNEEMDLEEFAPTLVMILALLGGFLRVLLLGSKGMWLDETFSVWLASQNVSDILQWIVKIDQHPPLYYLILHYWIGLNGTTPFHVRLLSVLFGMGTIPVIYLIGRRLSGTAVGLAAAVFLTLSPFQIYFAQEARMYTFLTFNASVATYALVRLLTDPRSVQPIGSQVREYLRAWRTKGPLEPDPDAEFSYKDAMRDQTGWRAWIFRHRWLPLRAIEVDVAWVMFVVFSATTLLSHNTAVLFIVAINIFVLGLMFFQRGQNSASQPGFQAPTFWNWMKAQIAILVLWSPWIFFFLKQAGSVNQRFWIPEPTWDAVIQTLKVFLNASAPLPAVRAMLMWSFYGLMLFLGLVHYRKNISRFLFLAALFVVPFVGELVVSIWRPIFLPRTLLWITIPLFVLLAAGIAQLRFRFLMISIVGILGTLNLFSAGDYYRFYQKEDWYSAAGYVALFAEQGDLVLFNSNFVEIPFNYYFEPYENDYLLRVEKHGLPLDLFESGVPEPEMTTADIPDLISLLDGHDRVWLVYSHDSYTDPRGLIPQTLASQRTLVETHEFYGGQIQLYASP